MKLFPRSHITLLCLSLLLACGLVELISRQLYPDPWLPVDASALYYRTPDGYRLRPNRLVQSTGGSLGSGQSVVRTNSLGLRGAEVIKNADQTILILGDSITLADYLNEEDTFVYKLQQATPAGWQVINGGISTLGLNQQLALLQELLLKRRIDTVAIDFFMNDATGCCAPAYLRAPWPLENSRFVQMFLHTYALRNSIFEVYDGDMPATLQESARAELQARENESATENEREFFARAQAEFLPWGISFAPATWSYFTKEFEKLKRLQEQYHFSVKVIVLPALAQVESRALFDFPQQQLIHIAKRYNWPVLDVLPLMRSQTPQEARSNFIDYCHLSPQGHQFVYSQLLPFLIPANNVK